VPEVGIFRTAGELGQRVVLDRIETTEAYQAIGKQPHLTAGPVVIRTPVVRRPFSRVEADDSLTVV
jgi:hypothetical protein